MRLEFQNRTKKAKIKAILAQAALHASNNILSSNDAASTQSTLANLLNSLQTSGAASTGGMPSRHNSHVTASSFNDATTTNSLLLLNHASKMNSEKSASSSASSPTASLMSAESVEYVPRSLLDPDQLMRFANSLEAAASVSSNMSNDPLASLGSSNATLAASMAQSGGVVAPSSAAAQFFQSTGYSSSPPAACTSFHLMNESAMTAEAAVANTAAEFIDDDDDEDDLESDMDEIDDIDKIKFSLAVDDDSVKQSTRRMSKPKSNHRRSSKLALTEDKLLCSISSSDSSVCRSRSFSIVMDEDSGMASMLSSQNSKIQPATTTNKLATISLAKQAQLAAFAAKSELMKSARVGSGSLNSDGISEESDQDDEDDHDVDDDNLSDIQDDDDDDSSDRHSDTSDDASDILDSDDLDSLSDNFDVDDDVSEILVEKKPLLLSEKDGSVSMRKSLECGIYCSVNQTSSLFIEPQDVLKPMEQFAEYTLFPPSPENQMIDMFCFQLPIQIA